MRQRYLIWLDRLNIFPLGLPDGVKPPEGEILKQLQEEIAKNCFRESLLADSDALSLAKARNLVRHECADDCFAYSDSTSSMNMNMPSMQSNWKQILR